MPIEKLTDRAIASKTKPGLYGDGGNLFLRVTDTGTRSWVFRYWRDGRRYALGLGPYPDVTLREARDLAYEQRRLRRNGDDPMTTKRARAAARHVAETKAMMFDECATAYIVAHQAGWRTAKEAREWTASMRTYAYPVFGMLPVKTIDLPLVLRVIEPLWQSKPSTGNRVRQRIENILDWAAVRGYRSGDNPARWKGHLENLLPNPSRVVRVKHFAALPYLEINGFLAKLRTARPEIAAKAVEFAVLTATRTGEVLGALWAELDLEAGVWTIPPERMKAEREHRVPLCAAALALLGALRRTEARVFPIGDVALWRVVKKVRPEITVHGFRSTFRDWAGETTAFPREVIEQCLAHAAGDQTELAYRRGDALDKRRQVMDAWARYCTQPKRDEIVLIGTKRSSS